MGDWVGWLPSSKEDPLEGPQKGAPYVSSGAESIFSAQFKGFVDVQVVIGWICQLLVQNEYSLPLRMIFPP